MELSAVSEWVETWEMDEFGNKIKLVEESKHIIDPSSCDYNYDMLTTYSIKILREDKSDHFYTVKYEVRSDVFGAPETGGAQLTNL